MDRIMRKQLLVVLLMGLIFYARSTGQDSECPKSFFMCKSGRCIDQKFICNGENDCGDNTDEQDCEKAPPPTECKSDEFQCRDHFHCIALEEFCDNKSDCIDGSDEFEGCHATKNCTEFKCNNGHCVFKNWVCDGVDDCKDNSDELHCDAKPIPLEQCNNTIGRYLCKNKRCIPLSQACNDRNDCGDDSDEDPAACATARDFCKNNHPCQQMCAATPQHPVCHCSSGYKLLNGTGGSQCEDVDECEEYGLCAQDCRNTAGSYYCRCEAGYQLEEDGKSCKAENGEALMVYAYKTSIIGYYLESQIYFPIAEDLQHVVGVSLDAVHIYWSDIQIGGEAIFRSYENGSDREVIVTAGLGCPEDIAVDWITQNIYFTDSMYKQIGVCSEGPLCTVIISEAEKPRGIALLPSDGKLYWSDWGAEAHISVANMDGSQRKYLITEKIGWPNGLTIDYPNKRIYWVDAKYKVIESTTLDGRDRRTILESVTKHPYSIAIFENRLYWSDWSTDSIHSCNKFTGKNFTTLFQKNETVYGIHIYHSSLKVTYKNPCAARPCSQLCLLAPNQTYSCACTNDKELNPDKHTCREIGKRKRLAIASKNTIIDYYQAMLGMPTIIETTTSGQINALTYDSLADTIIAADDLKKSIFRFNLHQKSIQHIIPIVDETVRSMAFDYFGNNLYESHTIYKNIEVHSLTTGEKTEFTYRESPYDLIVVPEEGIMFVVFRSNNEYHIDKVQMNGLGSRVRVVEHGLLGAKISLAYDSDAKRVYWADEGSGRIESINTEGQGKQLFRTGIIAPVSLAILDDDIFWTSRGSNRLHWSDKKQIGYKRLNLDVAKDGINIMHLQTISGIYTGSQHPCNKNNGNCSHICLVIDLTTRLCACPSGYIINTDLKNCRQKTSCSDDEIRCTKNGKCIKKIQRCNGVDDCLDGEDEDDCDSKSALCKSNEFLCSSGECINKTSRCDSLYDCKDKSDEVNCKNHTCNSKEYRCRDGSCISNTLVCNGMQDCNDASDEEYCSEHACLDHSFRCNSGQCIPQNWACDGQIDCNDSSDEHSSCKPTECGENMFSCKNGRCIDILLKCNSMDDCDDNSDESNCLDKSAFEALICTKDQYRCHNSTICIADSMRCNGHVECPKHDDEHNCGRCLENIQFTCHNGNCVPVEWICDSNDDCGDNSDEFDCKNGHWHPPQHVGPRQNCSVGMFACASGFCIGLDKFCDGRKLCLDGSDEGGMCDTACQENPCENICHKTPTGPVCSCREGYELANDGKSCQDIDECAHHVCPQHCTNQVGSYSCSCFDGYALRFDRISCKATGPVMKIFTATKDDIRMISPSSKNYLLTMLFRDPGNEINGLDVNARENTIYWSNENSGAITKMNIETKKTTIVSSKVGKPDTLSVDWITDNVYYVSNEQGIFIRVCNVDANKCSKIVHIEGYNNKVTDITVEPINEILFWSQTIWKIYEKPSSEIIRTDLIGANQKIIVHDNLGIVSGLTIDPHRSILYWADNYLSSIECVDFNGNNRKVILSELITKPIGLQFYEDSLYWKAEGRGVLRKRQLYGELLLDTVPIGSNVVSRLFVISQVSRQPMNNHVLESNLLYVGTKLQANFPNGPNKCKDRGCSHMCVIRKSEATCICPNGFPASIDNGTVCPTESIDDELPYLGARSLSNDNPGPVVTRAQQQSSVAGRRSAGTFTGLAVTLTTFVLISLVYFYLKKKKPDLFKRRDFSIHFQNPSFARRSNQISNTTINSSSILMPGEHEYTNPVTEMSKTKLSKCDLGPRKKLELLTETSDGEADEPTSYHSRLIR